VVSRDALGVPHILAANHPDVLFVQGYVTAQDRLFQMDALRRTAAGELAEVAGKGALESDRLMRRLRLARIAQEYARRLPASTAPSRACRGVNYFKIHRAACLNSHYWRSPAMEHPRLTARFPEHGIRWRTHGVRDSEVL
jgi:acyl-homoserine lactone acylase PvdQ